MTFNIALLFIIVSGALNGSFIIPSKHIKKISSEQIWFLHSVIGILILPWLLLILIQPQALLHFLYLPDKIMLYLILSGLLFGIGQIAFAYAITYIGIGLSFTINLGLAMILGSMFVVLNQHTLLSQQGLFVCSAIIFISLGMIINYQTQQHTTQRVSCKHYPLGWILAIIAGITSGLQNITFIIVAINHRVINVNPFWIWPPFLTAAALPMLAGFWYRSNLLYREKNLKSSICFRDILLIFLMGLFFVGSLALYSEGLYRIPNVLHIIAWPLFIIFIILTSQAWAWKYHEFRYHRHTLYVCLLFLLAIIMLATIQL